MRALGAEPTGQREQSRSRGQNRPTEPTEREHQGATEHVSLAVSASDDSGPGGYRPER